MTVRGVRWVDGLRLSVGTLTVVPTPPPGRVDRRAGGWAMVLAPLAVLPVAGVSAGTLWLAVTAGVPPLVAASLAVGLLALATRGLHLDGLADTVDGLACTGDRARALAVMRQGDVGPAGVVALVLTLLVQVGSLGSLAAGDPARAAVALVVAVLGSRAVLAVACLRGVPAARPGGLGATVAGSVPGWAAAVVVATVEVSAVLLLGAAGLVGTALAVAAAGAVLLWVLRRLGGITGDVLGALVEVALAAALLGLAAGGG